jgi:hypothetical protein
MSANIFHVTCVDYGMQMPTVGYQAFISLYLPEQRFVVQPDLSKEKGVHTTAMVFWARVARRARSVDTVRYRESQGGPP